MSNQNLPTSLAGRLLVGGIFAAPGLLIVAVGTRTIEVDPSTVHAPYWLLTLLGSMFVVAGLWLMTDGTPVGRAMKLIVGPTILIGLLTALHWVAFGPGVRQCSGGIEIPFVTLWQTTGDMQCRLAFGLGAVVFDGLVLGGLLTQLAKKMGTGAGRVWTERIANAFIVLGLIPLLPLVLLAVGLKIVVRRFRG